MRNVKYTWQVDLEKYDCFAPNYYSTSWMNDLKKLSKLVVDFRIIDDESIEIFLGADSEKALIFILTKLPGPSSCIFNARRRSLELCWS
jgi:hypothetical protein